MSLGEISPNLVSKIPALLLMARATALAVFVCSGPAMSILLMRSKSAASTCSANSSGTLRSPAQSSPSSVQFSRSTAESHVIQSVPNVEESTTVTMRLTSASLVAGCLIYFVRAKETNNTEAKQAETKQKVSK